MRQLSRYINENQSTVEKFLQEIVDSAIEDPVIWDDSGKWNARENFEFWEDADGSYDEIVNIIDKYASEKALAGWKTEDSFTETERYIPRKIFDIMRSGKHETPYKKYAPEVLHKWQLRFFGLFVSCCL